MKRRMASYGQKTLYFYDLNKRLKEEVGYFNDNRLFYRTEYKYDTIGNQIERYEYDSNNSLKRIKLYEYDEKGNFNYRKKNCWPDRRITSKIERKYDQKRKSNRGN